MRALVVFPLTAGVVALVALDGGSFSLISRQTLSIGVWLMVAAGFLFAQLPRLAPLTLVPAGLFVAFAAWTAASVTWSGGAERALVETHRVVLLVGVFLLPLVVLSRCDARPVAGGVAVGITVVAYVALASRVFPEEFAGRVGDLAVAGPRLSYPVGYWNGLGVLVTLGLALLVAEAGRPGAAWRRGLAVLPIPALACVVYLTSSRTAVAAIGACLVGLLALSPYRWSLAAAVVACAAAAAAAVASLDGYAALVNRPETARAATEGPTFLVVLTVISLALAAVVTAASYVVRRPGWATPRVGWAVVAIAAVAFAAAVGLSRPGERIAAFREPPETFVVPREDYIRAHLASSHGRGRWQLWEGAVDQFRSDPLQGGGAGSYAVWWAQNGTVAMFVQDAHSLYLETLGELGAVGIVLLIGFLASAAAIPVSRLFGTNAPDRASAGALLAVAFGFSVAAGLDWMWELACVAGVAMLSLGLALGVSEAASGRHGRRAWSRWRLAAAVPAVMLAVAAAVPLLAERELERSRAAAAAGDTAAALAHARAARAIQPWAPSGDLQLALVQERAGMLAAARRSIARAVEKDPDDWRLWLVSSRLAVHAGATTDARRSLARAARLNPRSQLFAALEPRDLDVSP